MNYFFLANALASFILVILIIYCFIKLYREKQKLFAFRWLFFTIIISYFLIFVLSSFWFFSEDKFLEGDYLFIYSIINFIQTLIFFKLVYSINHEKNMLYWLLIYFFSFFLFIFSNFLFLFVVLISSSFLMMVLAIKLINWQRVYHRAGYITLFYGALSLIFYFLVLLGIGKLIFYTPLLIFVFCILLFFLCKDFEKYNFFIVNNLHKKENKILVFINYFVFVIALTNFVLISTIGLHELSHVLVSRYYGCESRAIFYENNEYVYSEIVCSNLSGKVPISLAGFVGASFVGILIFFLGGQFMKPLALLMIGFNFMASYRDLMDAGFSLNISLIFSFIGIIFLFLGLVLLTKSKIQEKLQV